MRFKANRQDLLFEIESAVSTRSASNITSAVAFGAAEDGRLELRSCDAEGMLYQSSLLDVEGLDGRSPVAIKTKQLLDLLKTMDGDSVEIETSGLKTAISGGRFKASGLICYDASAFPSPPEIDPGTVSLKRIPFKRAARRVAHAVDSPSKVQPTAYEYLVLQLAEDGRLSLQACCRGHDVAVSSLYAGDGFKVAAALAPKSFLSAIDMPGGDEIALSFGQSWVCIEASGGWRKAYLRRAGVEAVPDYAAAVQSTVNPSDKIGDITTDRTLLVDLLARIESISGPEAPLRLKCAGGALSCAWITHGSRASEEIQVEGDLEFEDCINLTYLHGGTKAAEGDKLTLSYYRRENENNKARFLSLESQEHPEDVEIILCRDR